MELALETHRYFDCNRWKISDQVKRSMVWILVPVIIVSLNVLWLRKEYLRHLSTICGRSIKMKLIRILIFLYRIRDGGGIN